MFIPTCAALLLTAAVAPQQPVFADVPGATCPNCPASAIAPSLYLVSNTPATTGVTTAAAPTPAVAVPVQTYSYQRVGRRYVLVANPVTYSTTTGGTVYYSGCSGGTCPNAVQTYTFSSCPTGNCPYSR